MQQRLSKIKEIIHLLTNHQISEAKERLERITDPVLLGGLEDGVRDSCLLLLETVREYAYSLPPARLEDIVNDFYALVFLLPDKAKEQILTMHR